MSELCNYDNNKTNFISFVTSNLILQYSFIISHLLYFSDFIFFSYYLLKLIFFLSPLFITTFLLFSACHSTQTGCFPFLLSTYTSFLEKIQNGDNETGEFHCFPDLDLYEIVFGEVLVGIEESPHQVFDEMPELNQKLELNMQKTEKNSAEMEEKRLENFLDIVDMFERMSCSNEKEKKKIEPSKTSEVGEKQNAESMMISCGSEGKIDESLVKSKIKSYSQRVNSGIDYNDNGYKNYGNYGSMRKEKEWKRTLACKLFEERHNVDGSDGMDSLWETYEKNEPKLKNNQNKNNKKKIDVDHEDGDEFDYEGQLCCLQAFKLSAGKMNLGMKKPNLVKFSKVVKGIGWLSHLSKNNKKVHNNGDR